MKKHLHPMAVIATILLLNFNLYAQVSTAFNFGTGTDYVGWNAGQPFPLLIQHQGNQRINFATNGNVRMMIAQGGTGIPPTPPLTGTGYIGMGDNLGTAFTPTARLHLLTI